MHVVVNRVLGGFSRGLEQRAHIHVKADIGEGRGDHFRPAIMPVLAHLHHQHTGTAAFFVGEILNRFLDRSKACVALIGGTVDPCEGFDLGAVAAESFSIAMLISPTVARARAASTAASSKLPPSRGAARQFGQGCVACGLITGRAGFLDPRDLRQAHGTVVDIEDVDRVLFILAVFVHADDHLGATVDHGLTRGRRFLDPQLGHARGHGLGHAAQFLDLFDHRPCLFGQFMGQAFDVVGPRQRIDHIGHAGFFLQDQLGVARDPAEKSVGSAIASSSALVCSDCVPPKHRAIAS